MTLPGAARLDRALAKLEDDATDANTIKAAGELVMYTARPESPSTRVGRTGRVRKGKDRALVQFGTRATPWVVPSHFGHGASGAPRPQGGWMPAVPFLFKARDKKEDDVVDLILRRTTDVVRQVGLG